MTKGVMTSDRQECSPQEGRGLEGGPERPLTTTGSGRGWAHFHSKSPVASPTPAGHILAGKGCWARTDSWPVSDTRGELAVAHGTPMSLGLPPPLHPEPWTPGEADPTLQVWPIGTNGSPQKRLL